MRERITFKVEDILSDSLEEDEKTKYKIYAGEYVFLTMDFGQNNESKFKAIKVNPMNPSASVLDTWKFRFHSLVNSIEEAPTFGKRPETGWDETTKRLLEEFISHAPNVVGDKLLELMDKVNDFTDKEQKN